jgi:Holliday junction resolvase
VSGLRSRRKGAAGERELIRLLRDELGDIVSRNLSQTRDGGRDILGLPGYAVEVKRCEIGRIAAWKRQAVAQAADDELAVVAWRQNGRPWVFLVEGDEWTSYDLLGFCELVREGITTGDDNEKRGVGAVDSRRLAGSDGGDGD